MSKDPLEYLKHIADECLVLSSLVWATREANLDAVQRVLSIDFEQCEMRNEK